MIAILCFVSGLPTGAAAEETRSDAGVTLTGTNWTLVDLAGEEVARAPRVTLRFEQDGAVSGFDGCNRFRGSAVIDDAVLRFSSEMAMTQMACPDPISSRARAYVAALGRVTAFDLDSHRLRLRDETGNELASFEAVSQRLAGSNWKVISYNNAKQAVVSVLNGSEISVNFGNDGRVTGNAGCNTYFAEFQVSEESISIGRPGVTRRFCAEPPGLMEQESRFLDALHSVAVFRFDGNRLSLRRADDALAMNLVRDSNLPSSADAPLAAKIRFNLERLNADGLQGPPDGLRTLHYEYCIPDRPAAVAAVTDIDPTLEMQKGSPGRVGCAKDQLLCLGNTHQPQHRAVLLRLASLDFVTEINESVFE